MNKKIINFLSTDENIKEIFKHKEDEESKHFSDENISVFIDYQNFSKKFEEDLIKDLNSQIKRYHIHKYNKTNDEIESFILINLESNDKKLELVFKFDFYDNIENFGLFDVFLLSDEKYHNLDKYNDEIIDYLKDDNLNKINFSIEKISKKFKEFYKI